MIDGRFESPDERDYILRQGEYSPEYRAVEDDCFLCGSALADDEIDEDKIGENVCNRCLNKYEDGGEE